MYTKFFGLNEKPFAITPDPRYLFMSERHGEGLAHLVYGVTESGGFIQLTGEVGTGKTTLVRTLLSQLPDKVDVALILNPQLSALEFLTAICEELHIAVPQDKGSAKALVDALNWHLLAAHAAGRRTILLIDEAQNLSVEVLEQLRLLTNLETAKQKLLQIILIAQPELRDKLAGNDHIENGVSIPWGRMNHMMGCGAGWTDETYDQYFTRLQNPEGRHYMVGDQISYHSSWQEGAFSSAEFALQHLDRRVRAEMGARATAP